MKETVDSVQKKQALMAQLNTETSKMAWAEMQTFFASGHTVFVDPALDLIDIAAEFSLDNKPAFEAWIKAGMVGTVTDEQAKEWFEDSMTVWGSCCRALGTGSACEKEHKHEGATE